MKILSKISIIIFICLCMVSCSSNEAMAPASASDYSKGNYQKAVDSFERAGFTNIQANAIDDLTSNSTISDGTIIKISVGGTTDFKSMQLFPKDTPVIIEYHNIPKKLFPVNEEDIQSKPYDLIAKEFEKAGFIDITTEEYYDLDPDIEEKDFKNLILTERKKMTCSAGSILLSWTVQPGNIISGNFPGILRIFIGKKIWWRPTGHLK